MYMTKPFVASGRPRIGGGTRGRRGSMFVRSALLLQEQNKRHLSSCFSVSGLVAERDESCGFATVFTLEQSFPARKWNWLAKYLKNRGCLGFTSESEYQRTYHHCIPIFFGSCQFVAVSYGPLCSLCHGIVSDGYGAFEKTGIKAFPARYDGFKSISDRF